MIDLDDIRIADDETHHLIDNKPLYPSRFSQVMKFHQPGLAPVADNSGAFHIDANGKAAYKHRYIQTFGFYQGYAAVESKLGWLHIDINGQPLYAHHYLWCGNFQNRRCVVQSDDGYRHICLDGKWLYSEAYDYAGDFVNGVAVVAKNGLFWHITHSGHLYHQQKYLFVDVYHKGFARAQDPSGWFHIDKQGQPIYTDRYQSVEPFYNGLALCVTHAGRYVRINTAGQVVETIHQQADNNIGKLSGKMVGFWQTHTLHAAIDLGILNLLPATTDEIATQKKLSTQHTARLMRALWECEVVTLNHETWSLSEMGKLLSPSDTKFLAAAASMWHDVNNEWLRLITKLQSADQYHTSFKDNLPVETLRYYQLALSGYAQNDFEQIEQLINLNATDHVFAAGSCARVIIPKLKNQYPNAKFTLYDLKKRLRDLSPDSIEQDQASIKSFPLTVAWPEQYDIIIFPRFLHYWPDHDAKAILQQAGHALLPNGKLFIAEMMLDEHTPDGGLLDLNMLVETGGRCRTMQEWQALTKSEGFELKEQTRIHSYLSLLEFAHVGN